MSIDLLSLLAGFEPMEDKENQLGWFKTLVPWVGPEAYLNVIYKSAPAAVLQTAAKKWRFPEALVDFLSRHNGAMLFSGALNLYGVVDAAQLLHRQDRFSLPPFNIERENETWSLERDRLVVVGGYRFDGSRACMDRSDSRILVFKKSQREPTASWGSMESWITDEVARLRTLFDNDGKRWGPESETGPPTSPDTAG